MSNTPHTSTENYPLLDNNIYSTSTIMQQNSSSYGSHSSEIQIESHGTNGNIVPKSQNESVPASGVSHCFICSNEVAREVQVSLKHLTMRSHAPIIVLLTDVLGYKFEDVELHSECVCKTCYRLVNLIDELQQTLTESKTDVRTKFLDTLQKLKLKYPRTDKILKQRCSHLSSNCTAKKKNSATLLEHHGEEKEICSILEAPCCSKDTSKEKKNVDNSSAENNSNDPETEPLDIAIYDSDPAFYFNQERLKIGLHRPTENKYSCLYCKELFECDVALRLHARAHHLPSFLYEKGRSSPHLTNKKPRIGMLLQNVTMRQNDKCEHPYCCLYCDCTYKLLSTLLLHYKENHSEVKPYRCPYCNQAFRRAIQRTRHQVYHCQKSSK